MKKFTRIIAAALAAAVITVSAGTMSVSVSAANEGVAVDSLFLNHIGVSPNTWSDYYTVFNWKEASSDVDASWARVGVRCVSHPVASNEYYINGMKVTREEAFRQALRHTGKNVNIEKYFVDIFDDGTRSFD